MLEGGLWEKETELEALQGRLDVLDPCALSRHERDHACVWLRELGLGVKQLLGWARDRANNIHNSNPAPVSCSNHVIMITSFYYVFYYCYYDYTFFARGQRV